MKKKIIIAAVSLIIPILILTLVLKNYSAEKRGPVWEFRSVDTVKYSRDVAGQMLDRPEFDSVIEKQVSDIASLGATHVAIGAPYDQKYVPFLKRWVQAARNHNLKVWFRGNFSGWENWFGFKRIDREEHKKLLKEFIENNPDLFEDGDIFTSCPECENGGPGDPRFNGEAKGHKKFLIDEYNISLEAFGKINKKVNVGFYSMNYDVAKLIMDKETTKALGNIVVIDHYIKDPIQVSEDSRQIAIQSGGKVVLGELGVPIPDIHGEMSEEEQAKWIEQALEEARKTPEIVGINYWVNIGGSTRLWNDDGTARKAVDILRKFYSATKITQSP
ncbi:hypothetical protein HYS92_03135 [Candidatus Daviesbacteria bacterium]|nr:hypothetical protein [Candidatus Daviesbacteria bacterium]